MAADWTAQPAGARFGLTAGGAATPQHTETSSIPAPSAAEQHARELWHPDSPLLWFAGIAAITFGFMAVSTNVRVGKAKASVALGKS
ncbi:hypothetical protein Q6348_08035 [Isoptericola sp. b441]|uniref:Uncharacterized protein n=1 Tax=Actinotalea lenta TaxID=3064654 RepID=A0ABT9D8D3_9CELL|nr:hypothetical protein [Isoptericola sp. b441]MDO8107144.1 hypothetical protein [Isoptericola sp. b441]